MARQKIIDITYPIFNGMNKYPSDPEIEIERKCAKVEKYVFVAVRNAIMNNYGRVHGWKNCIRKKYKSGNLEIKMRNHHGTHIDAPAHKLSDGKKISDYPIDKFRNNCVLVDLTSTDLMEREKRMITFEDLNSCYSFDSHDYSAALIFYTGYSDEMKENLGKLSGDKKKDFEKKFPYFAQYAMKKVLDSNPFLHIIGMDSYSFDPSGSNSEVHRMMFEKEVLPLETLYNLGELRDAVQFRSSKSKNHSKIFELDSVPLNYENGDAAQTRAYAIV